MPQQHKDVTLGREPSVQALSGQMHPHQVNLVMSNSAFDKTDSIRYPKPSIGQKLLELLRFISKKEKAIEAQRARLARIEEFEPR